MLTEFKMPFRLDESVLKVRKTYAFEEEKLKLAKQALLEGFQQEVTLMKVQRSVIKFMRDKMNDKYWLCHINPAGIEYACTFHTSGGVFFSF